MVKSQYVKLTALVLALAGLVACSAKSSRAPWQQLTVVNQTNELIEVWYSQAYENTWHTPVFRSTALRAQEQTMVEFRPGDRLSLRYEAQTIWSEALSARDDQLAVTTEMLQPNVASREDP